MKFRFYITDLFLGNLTGTNDAELAKQAATSEDMFVVDAETGNWLVSDGTEEAIKETELKKGE